jgi:hypothetical protein
MTLVLADLLAPVTLPGPSDALRAWRWLTGKDAAPWMVTALGDVFLRMGDGRIDFLDTYEGRLRDVATVNTGWMAALQVKGNLDQWFDPRLVAALRARGLTLGPEQCYSPVQPLILGGRMEADNFEVTEWRVHAGLMGQIYEQLRADERSARRSRQEEGD